MEREEYQQYRKSKQEIEKELIEESGKIKDDFEINPDDQNKFFLKQKEKDETELVEFKKELTEEVLRLLAQKETKKATDRLKAAFKKLHPVYSIRNDRESEIYIYKNGIYIPEGKSHIKEFCDEVVGFHVSAQLINEVILKIEISSFIEQDQFYQLEPKDEIAVLNGVLNVKTKKLKRFTPRKVFFNKIPIHFSPKAKAEKSLKFFGEILENPEDIVLLQELLGYLFLKDYQIEKAFMFLGKGRNGKGQLLELIKNLTGMENTSAVSLQRLTDETSFNIVELHNKLVNIGGDISDTYLQETGLFKSLTGNDLISCDRKFKTHLKFRNHAKLIFSCNKLPKTKDNSRGFWDRWVLLKFPYRFEYAEIIDKLPNEEKELCKIRKNNVIQEISTEEEKSGLLNWGLDGLQRLLETQHFTFTKSTQNVRERWIKEADSFAAFCDEELQEEYDSLISKEELRQCYNDFCKKNQVESVTDKHINYYLTTEMRAVSKRYRDENQDIMVWKNLSFVKGVKAVKGFSVYRKKNDFTVGSNSLVRLDRLDKIKENNILVSQKTTINDLFLEFENNKVLDIEYLLINYTQNIIDKAKEIGFIYEFEKGKFRRL